MGWFSWLSAERDPDEARKRSKRMVRGLVSSRKEGVSVSAASLVSEANSRRFLEAVGSQNVTLGSSGLVGLQTGAQNINTGFSPLGGLFSGALGGLLGGGKL